MNVLQNLVVYLNQLPPDSTYRNVCVGILGHLEEAAKGTIYDLAELTNSSRTTIWRMVQKMGYTSFSDFHYELKQAVKKYSHYNRILPQENCTSVEAIRDAVTGQMEKARWVMENYVDTDLLERAAGDLYRADKVSFYVPFHSSAVFCLQQNLAVTGVETAYYSLFPEMLADSATLTEKSVVFVNMIDHAETMDFTEVFENAISRHSKLYGIQCGRTKYEEYLTCDLVSDDSPGVLKGMIIFDMYFYFLNEVYRMKYID